MKKFWQVFYNIISYPLFHLFFLIAPLFKEKIRITVKDRRKLFEDLIINLAGIDRRKKMVWFHSASMGEFEQAKPIIEKLKSQKNVNIIVTFFSPSGYRNSLKYPYADIISYLPFDIAGPTERFLNIVQPDLAVFMRYDIWPNMVWQLEEKNIPHL
jgi:3-deoxy-D-manno-octulosonic-acid transferase